LTTPSTDALAGAICVLVSVACNVPEPPAGTGGAQVDSCRSIAVVRSDYASTSVAVASLDGGLLSESILSSGSSAPGASAPLSGDVLLPHDAPASGDLVLIDAYPNAVVTWVDPAAGLVREQRNVATGFAANPHDYLEVSADKAYVTRYNSNLTPGREPFDRGGDILMLARASGAPTRVMGRIDLSEFGDLGPASATAILPRPDRMTKREQTVYVTLGRFDFNYNRAADAVLVAIDSETDRVNASVTFAGYKNCRGLALAPRQALLAVACVGVFREGPAAQVATSGVVIVDVTGAVPRELRRIAVSSYLGGATPSPALAFADDATLWGVGYGGSNPQRSDVLYRIDLPQGSVTEVARPAGGSAFVYGDIHCGCDGVCTLADAESFQLLSVSRTVVTPLFQFSRNLPPRFLGGLRR
jgi:hypothetical protein